MLSLWWVILHGRNKYQADVVSSSEWALSTRSDVVNSWSLSFPEWWSLLLGRSFPSTVCLFPLCQLHSHWCEPQTLLSQLAVFCSRTTSTRPPWLVAFSARSFSSSYRMALPTPTSSGINPSSFRWRSERLVRPSPPQPAGSLTWWSPSPISLSSRN